MASDETSERSGPVALTRTPEPVPAPARRSGNPNCAPCSACTIRPLTMCAPLTVDELPELVSIQTRQTVGAGSPIFDEGEPADHMYNITNGAVKIYKLLADGRRQITGFMFAADILGLAGPDGESYVYSAEAITEVKLCRFPRRKLESMLDHHPKMEKRLLGMTANELASAQDQMLLLGRKTAKERIATFLLQLSRRAELRGAPPDPVQLPMSRADIADYLGLTTETVSRTITQLKRDRVITLLEGNRVQLTNLDTLDELSIGT